MPKSLYVCVLCGERFSRFSNGKRHLLNLHRGSGEIVSWTEYSIGRLNNRYQPTQPSPSRRGRYNSYRTAIAGNVADAIGDTFPQMHVGGQAQEEGQIQKQQQNHQPYPQQQQHQALRTTNTTTQTNPMPQYLALRETLLQPQQPIQQGGPSLGLPSSQPQPPNPEKKNSFWLTSETIFQLCELKALVYKHSNAFPDYDMILQGAKHFCMQGDDGFLQEKLKFFRAFDAQLQTP